MPTAEQQTVCEQARSFTLGTIVMTANALTCLTDNDVKTALSRHVRCDWGDLESEDKLSNDHALQDGGRLFSAYHSATGTKFYIITEWDRSYTTILLPEDY